MNNRLSIPDVAGLLAEYTGKNKKNTELFLREFISIVREGVFNDRIVKIKGIGAFKIIKVEDRESIHVNTGERILIPEHYKFSFTPDKDLKEQVNKPFSFFETIEISTDADFGDTDVVEEITEEATADNDSVTLIEKEEETVVEVEITETIEDTPVPEVEAAIEEEEVVETITIETVVEGIETAEDSEEIVQEELIEEQQGDIPTPIVEAVEEIVPLEEDTTINEEEKQVIEETEELLVESIPMATVDELQEEMIPVEETPASEEETIIESKPEVKEEIVSSTPVIPVKKSSNKFSLIAAIIALLLIGGGIFFYTQKEVVSPDPTIHLVENIEMEEVEQPLTDDENIDEPEGDVVLEQPAEVTPPKDGLLATVKMTDGNRLTLISQKYYNHKIFWVYLYEHNKDVIKNPNNIPIGTTIKVPAPELYNIDANNSESVRKASQIQSRLMENN